LDLFSGIGGFALGAYWAGMRFDRHFFSEIDSYCVELYQKRFPDSEYLGDITKIDFKSLKKDYPGEWIITGGFPCQDISIAGKGAGIEEERSGLWFEMWRAIRILRPEFVIAENVGAITFRGLDQVLSSLAEIGYDAEWQDIRAEDMGAPHRRERIWIIAYPHTPSDRFTREGQRAKIKKGLQQRSEQTRKLQSGLKGLCNEISNTEQKHDDNTGYGTSEIFRKRSEQTEIQECFSNPNQERLQALGKQEGLFEKKRQACSSVKRRSLLGKEWNTNWWNTEPAVGRVANGIPRRVDRLKGLGNSIVPQIAEILFRLIKELL
jgi:DNA (cytosine-5)-methyltransferase 1